MKILLVTLKGNFNWGNKLQNYALQTVLENLGAEVTNLDYWREENPLWCILRYAKHLLWNRDIKVHRRKGRRLNRIMRWSKQNLHNTIRVSYKGVFQRNWQEYDGAVTGSDQVWHRWYEDEFELPYFYLEFVEESKRISYAPSFGFEEFPGQDKEIHRQGLQGMRFLSCREVQGSFLIKELTGRDAVTVLDPTLLLSRKEWETCVRKPEFVLPDKYILLYFLGGCKEYEAEIERIREKYQCEVLNMYDANEEAFTVDPFEFLYLVQHAECVCTDSFHATVFSIIFKRELEVFERKQKGFQKMFCRITEFLAMSGRLNCINGNADMYMETPYRGSLEENIQRSEQYLREALQSLK